MSGSFSPSPSPVFTSVNTMSPSSADLPRLRRELDEAKRKIKQWEEALQQVKQVRASGLFQLLSPLSYQGIVPICCFLVLVQYTSQFKYAITSNLS